MPIFCVSTLSILNNHVLAGLVFRVADVPAKVRANSMLCPSNALEKYRAVAISFFIESYCGRSFILSNLEGATSFCRESV